jgi:hypothetical protein
MQVLSGYFGDKVSIIYVKSKTVMMIAYDILFCGLVFTNITVHADQLTS